MRLQEVTQHRAEVATLRAGIDAEFAALSQRKKQESTLKTTPLNHITAPGPMDAEPLLQAWQAWRTQPNPNTASADPAQAPHLSSSFSMSMDPFQLENWTSPYPIEDPTPTKSPYSRPGAAELFLSPGISFAFPRPSEQQQLPPKQLPNPQIQPQPQPANPSIPHPHPLWPNTPHLRPIQRPTTLPHVPRKRGPYKKKEKALGSNATPPPARVVGRGGMVSLSRSKQATDVLETQRVDEGGEAGTGAESAMSAFGTMGGERVDEGAVLPPYAYQTPVEQRHERVPLAGRAADGREKGKGRAVQVEVVGEGDEEGKGKEPVKTGAIP
jgi:hypothetical protein